MFKQGTYQSITNQVDKNINDKFKEGLIVGFMLRFKLHWILLLLSSVRHLENWSNNMLPKKTLSISKGTSYTGHTHLKTKKGRFIKGETTYFKIQFTSIFKALSQILLQRSNKFVITVPPTLNSRGQRQSLNSQYLLQQLAPCMCHCQLCWSSD